MVYSDLVGELIKNSDKKYLEFTSVIGASPLKKYGVRVPIVKGLAKEHYLDSDLDLSEFVLNEYTEINFLYLQIGLKRCKTPLSKLEFVKENLEYFNSWELTDMLPQELKKLKYDDYLKEYNWFIKQDNEYTKRIGYVLGLNYYKEKDINPILKGIENSTLYYTYMAISWLLATLAITHFESVKNYLVTSNLDLGIKRKTVSKMIDSFRISDDNKSIVRKLRDNNFMEE